MCILVMADKVVINQVSFSLSYTAATPQCQRVLDHKNLSVFKES